MMFSKARAESARARARADSALTVGRGEDFLTRQQGFFYENGCNSGMESRKTVPKVGKGTVSQRATNRPLTKIGVVWQKLDILAIKTEILGPKNPHCLLS